MYFETSRYSLKRVLILKNWPVWTLFTNFEFKTLPLKTLYLNCCCWNLEALLLVWLAGLYIICGTRDDLSYWQLQDKDLQISYIYSGCLIWWPSDICLRHLSLLHLSVSPVQSSFNALSAYKILSKLAYSMFLVWLEATDLPPWYMLILKLIAWFQSTRINEEL